MDPFLYAGVGLVAVLGVFTLIYVIREARAARFVSAVTGVGKGLLSFAGGVLVALIMILALWLIGWAVVEGFHLLQSLFT